MCLTDRLSLSPSPHPTTAHHQLHLLLHSPPSNPVLHPCYWYPPPTHFSIYIPYWAYSWRSACRTKSRYEDWLLFFERMEEFKHFEDMRGSEHVKYLQGAYTFSEYFAKPYFHKHWTEIHNVTTVWMKNVCSFSSDHDVQIAVGTRVEPPQNPANSRTRPLRSAGEAASSLQNWFTLFPRDGSRDYRTIPNVNVHCV
jgi:hypothetical protein